MTLDELDEILIGMGVNNPHKQTPHNKLPQKPLKYIPAIPTNPKMVMDMEIEWQNWPKEKVFTQAEIVMAHNLKDMAKDNSGKIIGSIFDSREFIITGGCFASWYHDQPPNDIDVFVLKNWTETKSLLEELSTGGTFLKKKKDPMYNIHGRIFSVYDYDYSVYGNSTIVQYVATDYDTVKDLINHFDMEHTKAAYVNNTLYVSPLTLECIQHKFIKIPENAINRIKRKRIEKLLANGWNFHPAQTPYYGV